MQRRSEIELKVKKPFLGLQEDDVMIFRFTGGVGTETTVREFFDGSPTCPAGPEVLSQQETVVNLDKSDSFFFFFGAVGVAVGLNNVRVFLSRCPLPFSSNL